MKSKRNFWFRMSPIAGAVVLASTAWASPPAGSDYAIDQAKGANEYVQDVTSDGLANVNMVLCVMHGMGLSDMLTQHGAVNSAGLMEAKYVALIDMNKCDTKNRSSSSSSTSGASGAGAATNYMTAIVDVTAETSATPTMTGKAWMTMTDSNGTQQIWVRLTASNAPGDLPPYGKLHVDYVGYPGSVVPGAPISNPSAYGMIGYIDTNGAAVSYVETGTTSSPVALTLNAGDTNTGTGKIQAQDQSVTPAVTKTYTFAYNPVAYARSTNGGADVCFDRLKSHADRSVWSYGVYDAGTGARIDQANPSFPIKATVASTGLFSALSAGSTTYGYAGYWGIGFGGVKDSEFAALPDGAVRAFSSIVDQRPNKNTQYTLYKSGGKLTRWTPTATTLDKLAGIPFNMGGEGCKLVYGGNGVPGSGAATMPDGYNCTNSQNDFQNWTARWNATTAVFELVGYQSCQPGSPCMQTSFAPVTVQQDLSAMPLNGWSDALGPVVIAPVSSTAVIGHPGADANVIAVYYTQSVVLPGVALPGSPPPPTDLYCLSNCPTSADITAFLAGPQTTPYATPTDHQWGGLGASQVHYTFDSGGLKYNGTEVVMATALPNGPSDAMSGRMFASTLVNGSCPNMWGLNGQQVQAAVCEPSGATVEYYTYQTGPNMWDRATWLVNNATSAVVQFDPPQPVPFTVPRDSTLFGTWAGKSIQLQFNGFGNLQGIPGHCVDPQTNLPVDCTQSTRYVPEFALPDGTPLSWSTASGTQNALTLALQAEVRLAKLSSCPSVLSAQNISLSLPPDPTENPADPSVSSIYIGTPVTPSSTAPAVVDGVLK